MQVLFNAKIHTLDSQNPWATAIVIDRDRIVAIGESAVILDSYADNNRLVRLGDPIPSDRFALDLEGRSILPGLTDAHIHLEHYTLGLQKVDCETATKEECLRRVAERAGETPPGSWVLGHGWNQNNWDRGFGSAEELDVVAPRNPVYLTAKSLHAGWANTTALRIAGVTSQSLDPDGGRISRDNNGEPDGILFETAMQLVAGALPEPGVDDVIAALRQAQPTFWKLGLTGVHDFDRRRCWQALQRMHLEGDLGIRVVKSLPLDDLEFAAGAGLASGFGDDFLRIGSVKAFADGALGPQTAAMLQPYEGDPGNRGILMLDGEELFERGRLAVDSGLSMAVHAIGDRANHEVLNGFEQLRGYEQQVASSKGWNSSRMPLRHRIEHVQVIHLEDAGRLASLDIIASMQPVHAPSDMYMADRFWGKRSELAYAWRAQLEKGALLVFGSDAPVESPNPFWGLHAAVTRRRIDGEPGTNGWYPEQRLSLLEALRGFTVGPAYAAGMEDRLGRLLPGFLADLIVLEMDPFQMDPNHLHELLPIATMIGGKWVHGFA